MPDSPAQLSQEDTKLITLARSALARTGAAEGAAVRDENGRTYAAATVDLPSLQLSAVQVCIAMAVVSGSRSLEAVVVLSEASEPTAPDLAVIRDLGGEGVVVHIGDARGSVTATLTA
ncbi:cytidine deaminase [Nocardioides sp.]|uniref:cytidine deaminase n=1 Tax=Nocardioides sp. TaxID=35761 RepID=UPI002735E85B|nr:cytidine deaminase [Nocardioides sp.]MDP3889776.1 cytidine deaminase [Nocardioides sp.]